ncbi:hypothetical protein NH340_JMT09088 [Sarcoptes scabiei]|nr:hypothetical protein NH340_JMT09088 [Sarcoptes scabiei]
MLMMMEGDPRRILHHLNLSSSYDSESTMRSFEILSNRPICVVSKLSNHFRLKTKQTIIENEISLNLKTERPLQIVDFSSKLSTSTIEISDRKRNRDDKKVF